ncbi:3D domain-containing protein [Rummeliibacillus pycnus]|uniref:3D domain-containing protein n=1 Tax=Rummeliibacillus pycnus TaxID=101070 RepID=UPI001FE7926F|nr:3D domain-containing protein [Rummeliibacillus pycnus]
MSNNSMQKLFLKSLRNQQMTPSIMFFVLAFAVVVATLFGATFTTVNAKTNGTQQEKQLTKNKVSKLYANNFANPPSLNTNNSYEQEKNTYKKPAGATSTTVADFLKQPTVESGENSELLDNENTQNANDTPTSDVRVEKVIDVVEDSHVSANRNSNKEITQVSQARQYHTTGKLNMRKGPGTKYKLIKTIPKGKNVTYRGRKGSWYKVSYSGKTGYVSKKYLKSGTIKKVSISNQSMYVTSTAYTAYCNGCSGKTKIGIDLRKNPYKKVIAVDPRVIPLRKMVYVNGYGLAIAGDTGSAIKGRKIDVFMPTKKQAYNWGRRTVKVTVQN